MLREYAVLDLAAYQRDAEAFLRALGRERYLHQAGLKATLDLCPLYADFAHLFRADTFGELLEAECEPRPKRYLLDFAASGYLDDRAKVLTEQVADEAARAQVVCDEQPLPYRAVPIALANEPDAHRRRELDARYREVTRRLNPLFEERHRTLMEATPELEQSDYVALYDGLRDLHLGELTEAAERFLAATEGAYFDALEELLGTVDIALQDAVPSDLAWLFRAPRFDDYFAARAMLTTLYRTVRELGFELEASSHVTVDAEPRPLKSPRAFCARLAVPDDVRLVLAPTGGRLDYEALFHEAGHAEHYANVDRTLPFPDRWLGDNSVSESYAFLLQHLLTEPKWLGPRLEMEQPADYLRIAMFHRLYLVRRHATKLLYEPALHRSDNYDALADRYAELFTGHLGVEYARENYLADVDDGLYAALYFRAWIFEAQHRQYLGREFDEEWFRLARAGRFLRELWREGQRYPVDELARFMGFSGLDLRPLTDELRAGVG